MARKSRDQTNAPQTQLPATKTYYIGVYVRLSVKDEDSIINQEELIRRFLNQHEDLVVSRVYVDDGRSSFIGKRPEFDRMIADAKNKNINCIVVKDFSRFGRNYIELGDYLETIFPIWGTRFISISDNYDSEGMHGHPDFATALKGVINTAYSRDLSNKVKSIINIRQKEGTYIPAKVPYGYVKNSNSHFIPDKETAGIVRRIFIFALEGKSAYVIAGLLNTAGIRSPGARFTKNKNSSDRLIWTRNKVMSILRDKTYIGCLVMGKTENLYWHPRKPIKRPVHNWIVVPNHHEAIVPTADFNNVQKTLDARKSVQSNEMESEVSPEIYWGSRLYCGDCGRKMKRRMRKGVTYFVCPRTAEAKGSCVPKSIKANMLKYDIWEAIQLEVGKADQHRAEKLAYESSPSYRLKRAYLENQLGQLNCQSTELEQSKLAFYTARLDNGYCKSDLQLFMNCFNLQKYALNEEIERRSAKLSDYDNQISADSIQIRTLLKYEGIEELTSEMYEELVEKVYCYRDKIDVVLRFTV